MKHDIESRSESNFSILIPIKGISDIKILILFHREKWNLVSRAAATCCKSKHFGLILVSVQTFRLLYVMCIIFHNQEIFLSFSWDIEQTLSHPLTLFWLGEVIPPSLTFHFLNLRFTRFLEILKCFHVFYGL